MRVVRSSDRPTIFSMLPDATLPLHFAQVVATAQVTASQLTASQLFVGFSDDGRVVVPVLVLVLLLFFVFIIIIGISRRYRVAAHDSDEAPNVVRDAWSHDRLLRRRGDIHDDVSARVRAGQSVHIAVLHEDRLQPSLDRWSARHHCWQAGLAYSADASGLILKARRCSRFASTCGSVFLPTSLSLSMMS